MKYSILYADPSWSYRDKAQSGNRGAEFKYQCMTVPDLMEMKDYIDEISEDNAVMFMWTTAPMLPVAISLMAHWKFDYKTIAFTWIKKTRNNKLFWGMGNYTRSNPEYVILGVRGKGIKRTSASVHSVIESEIREHSRKPDEVRLRINKLYEGYTGIELFARQRTPGWDVHGLETDKFICADSVY